MKTLRIFSASAFVVSCMAMFFSLLFLIAPDFNALGKVCFPASVALAVLSVVALVYSDNAIANQKLRASFGVFRG